MPGVPAPHRSLLLLAIVLAACVPEPQDRRAAGPAERAGPARPPSPVSEGSQCGTRGQRVLITVLDAPAAVQARRAEANGAPILSQDAKTLVFADGRVFTSSLEDVGEHLGRVGWVDREIVISSRFQRGGGAARRRPG